MSRKSWFKGLRNKTKEVPAPRDLATITKEYTDIAQKAGQASYQYFVFSKHLEQLNNQLLTLNQEADLRNKLNAEEAKQKGAKNEQT